MVPVSITAIKVDEHVVNEVIHLEQLGILHVWLAVGAASDEVHVALMVGKFVDEVGHRVPRIDSSVGRNRGMILSGTAINFGYIPFSFRSSEVLQAIILCYAFAQIVHAPVESIDKEVDVLSRTDWIAQLRLLFSCPEVASILCRGAWSIFPMLP